MTSLHREQVEEALRSYLDPYLGMDLVTAKAIQNISVTGEQITVDVVLGYPAQNLVATLKQQLTLLLQQTSGIQNVTVNVTWKILARVSQAGTTSIPGVKNIIAVASGKGGVGKSTTAVNLALALAAEGAQVGILDADIYGPNQPQMLGAKRQPESTDGKSFEPIVSHGIQSMSIGYMIDVDTAMIWRGPMVTGALSQLLNETRWHDVDYLIVDLPPGTGDIHLSLAQKIPVTGAVIVTTPQDIALLDARKGLKMFEKVKIPVFGIIENMSVHTCSQCGHQEHIFGEGGGAAMAKQYNVPFLGSLPLDIRIRECADQGTPIVVMDPKNPLAINYCEIARTIAAKISLQAKNYMTKFPKIVIENK